MKQPVFILISAICLAFFYYSLLYAATKAEIMQAIAEEKAQVAAARSMSMACDTAYWGHNMISVRYEAGVWYYSCQIPWEGNGVQATNVYYHP